MLCELSTLIQKKYGRNDIRTIAETLTSYVAYPDSIIPRLKEYFDSPYLVALVAVAGNIFGTNWHGLKGYNRYGQVDTGFIRDDNELKEMAALLKDTISSMQLRKYHDWYDYNDPATVVLNLVSGKDVLFANWPHVDELGHRCGIVYGLFWDKLFNQHNWPKYSSNIGYAMAWNIDQIDTTNKTWLEYAPGISENIFARITHRFGADPSKFTWNFGDWWLLYPVALSIMRDKPVAAEYLSFFYKWCFRRDWATGIKIPQEVVLLQALSKKFEEYRTFISEWKNYKRGHMVTWIAGVCLKYPDTMDIKRSQLGDIAPQLVKLALKKEGYTHLASLIGKM